MKNTPTPGAEALTDGAFENWTTATNATSWTESTSGTSTVNQETSVIHGGSSALRFDVDGSNSAVSVSQTALTVGLWYVLTAWMKASGAGKMFGTDSGLFGPSTAVTVTTSYVQYTTTGRAGQTAFNIKRSTGTSASLYADDVSVKPLTLNHLFAVRAGVSLPASVVAQGTISPGTTCGVVYGLDSIGTPTNCILAIHDGQTGIQLLKMVAGVWSVVLSTTATYSAGFLPQIKWVSANTFGLWYKGVQASTNQTISDAGTGLLHGAFSTSPLNTITGVFVS